MMRRDDLLSAFARIRDEVESLAEAADRLGMSRPALDKALERARKDGDPRAQWRGLGWRLGMGAPKSEPLTPEEAFEEVNFLAEQGVPWDEALIRVVPNRTPLSRAVRDLRRSTS